MQCSCRHEFTAGNCPRAHTDICKAWTAVGFSEPGLASWLVQQVDNQWSVGAQAAIKTLWFLSCCTQKLWLACSLLGVSPDRASNLDVTI